MFRLLKLAALAFLGYAVYEFLLGIMHESQPQQGQGGSSPSRSRGSSRQSEGGGQAFKPSGVPVSTESSDGGRGTQVVGRGVVH